MRHLGPLLVALGLTIAPTSAMARGTPALDKTDVATIDVLDVGQGDAILIRSPEGKTALIDAGPSKDIVPALRRKGVTSIDLVVVSHHHADHYGGMDDVIRAFHPGVFLATDSSHTTPQYLKLLTLVRGSRMQAVFPTDVPRKLELGSVVLTVLPQSPEDKGDENDNSIGIRLQHGAFSMLLSSTDPASKAMFTTQTWPREDDGASWNRRRQEGYRRKGLAPPGRRARGASLRRGTTFSQRRTYNTRPLAPRSVPYTTVMLGASTPRYLPCAILQVVDV
jgi:hypothetical protein